MNWKSKLASRKFWALIAAVAVSVLAVFGYAGDSAIVLQVTGIIGAVGAVAVYILGESIVDAAAAKAAPVKPPETPVVILPTSVNSAQASEQGGIDARVQTQAGGYPREDNGDAG